MYYIGVCTEQYFILF